MIEKQQLRLFDEVQNAVFATLFLLDCFFFLFLNFLFDSTFAGWCRKKTSVLRTTLIQQSYTFK